MDTRAETTWVRFRIDETLKARAEAVCDGRGLDLHDVLRTLVRRIAVENAIPFDLDAPAGSGGAVRRPSGAEHGPRR